MAKTLNFTPDQLRQLFRYHQETGDLFWLPRSPDVFPQDSKLSPSVVARRWNTKYAGRKVDSIDTSTGYIRASLLGTRLYAHRIIWAMHYGAHPSNMVDHINGIKTDNRLSNLRAATMADNQHNRRVVPKVNGRATSSHYCGVYLNRRNNRWIAKIRAYDPIEGSVQHGLGTYGCQTAAALAYDAAAKRLHGEFARTNF